MISGALVILVAASHAAFAALEIIWWTRPAGRRAFGLTPEFAVATRALAANQGVYNLFLTAGLIWSVVHPDRTVSIELAAFFLGCVVVAGTFGAATVSRRIFFVQAAPALAALAALVAGI